MAALEARLMPLAAKMAQQRHLGAIRDAYISFMPFIIVGSILLVISSFPSTHYQQFMASVFGEGWSATVEIPFNAIFSTMAVFISFLVAYRAGGTLRHRQNVIRHFVPLLLSDPDAFREAPGSRQPDPDGVAGIERAVCGNVRRGWRARSFLPGCCARTG
ncbi:cellobiose phosphotransferase system IIC component [Cedecea neteri]|uniref:Cellobiose phosphotransferase system IIC component n=1 Tax=Cedecea neteri TaxID=158822 RepID=A0A2X2T7E1_9ENTR|nr:cellobiose phosphotransferase system IIC component [Cedecea neteri]